MSSRSWPGEQEMQSTLSLLCEQLPASISTIKKVVAAAFKYQNEYKMVVYEIEKFIKKSAAEYKLGGLFVMDAVCRQSKQASGRDKDQFCQRFALRLPETISFMEKSSVKDKISVARLVEEWEKKGIFPKELTRSLPVDRSLLTTEAPAAVSAPSSVALPSAVSTDPRQPPTVGSTRTVDPRKRASATISSNAVPSKRDSASSSVVSSSNPTTTASSSSASSNKPPPRLCPFREGNCPFSDKCRFSHIEPKTFNNFNNRMGKRMRPEDTISSYTLLKAAIAKKLARTSTMSSKSDSELTSIVDSSLWRVAIKNDHLSCISDAEVKQLLDPSFSFTKVDLSQCKV